LELIVAAVNTGAILVLAYDGFPAFVATPEATINLSNSTFDD
jgi:hypothetical protein